MKKILSFLLFSTVSSFTYSITIDQSLLEKAQSGDRVSQEEVAKFYEFSGREGESLSWLYKASENGSGYAAGRIAKSYYDGEMGLTKNRQEAWAWYKKGAALKDPYSLKYMANYYKNQDIEGKRKALNYLLMCVKPKENEWDHSCLLEYAKLKRELDGPLDIEAKRAFEYLAKLGDGAGYTELADYYENGYIFEKDIDKAHKYLEIAAAKGERIALQKLGSAYLDGDNYGLSIDEQKGINYLEKSGKLGNGFAYGQLGDHYFVYDKKDLNKAIFYYKKGVELDDIYSAWNLAALYNLNFLKPGYDRNYYKNEIAKLLIMSADGGLLEAQLALGEAYEKGYHNLFSIEKAKKYYQLAAQQGSGEAKLKLKGFN